ADVARLVAEVPAPVNVVMGLASSSLTVADLRSLGVRRISVGGSLARACLGLVRRASRAMLEHGRFDYAEQQIPDADLCNFFALDDALARRQGPY
ncbi:MAG TPA: isocitrate lyase/phosphoenolpyruvate mutase family protein, partial [Hydrogenophaga sp.]|nr:isocitrate lyase/phosphoenolpyruvate mutase family protein [Hydrogenophaga sp.]